MALGLSAGAISAIGAVAGPVIGGLMGGQSSGQSSTQKQELDPRMQALLYGSEGSPGLLGDADALRKQQMAQGGLNGMQRSGLEMQRQTLMSPQYTQGYDQMRNMGSQLMGAGVSGNPFANGGGGRIPQGQGQQATMAAQPMPQQQMQPFQYQREGMQDAYSPMAAYQAPPQPEQQKAVDNPLDEYMRKLAEQQDAQYRQDELRGAGAGY